DPYQLQAVGRGGLFQELCSTSRAHQLARIHRFDEAWEAAASLQLRHGDPRGLDAYIEHGRVVPGTIEEHLEGLTEVWIRTAARNGTMAISASSNEHVDLINEYLQRVRAERGQIDTSAATSIGGGERA